MSVSTDFLPLSALQHFVYCPRQCALIHLEQQWTENQFTAEGRILHERVDRPENETRDGIRREYAVRISSSSLGLVGQADSIEFYQDGKCCPVEYKRGRPKFTHCDWIQLCAQALCLEEMMGIDIPEGAIFYGQPRRRQVVEFTQELREETEKTARSLHQLMEAKATPPARYERKKCESCSLLEVCMPKKHLSVDSYIRKLLQDDS